MWNRCTCPGAGVVPVRRRDHQQTEPQRGLHPHAQPQRGHRFGRCRGLQPGRHGHDAERALPAGGRRLSAEGLLQQTAVGPGHFQLWNAGFKRAIPYPRAVCGVQAGPLGRLFRRHHPRRRRFCRLQRWKRPHRPAGRRLCRRLRPAHRPAVHRSGELLHRLQYRGLLQNFRFPVDRGRRALCGCLSKIQGLRGGNRRASGNNGQRQNRTRGSSLARIKPGTIFSV